MIVLTSPGSSKVLQSLGRADVAMVGTTVVEFAGDIVGKATSVTVGTGGTFVGVGDEGIVSFGSMLVVAFAGTGVVVGGSAGIVTVGTG